MSLPTRMLCAARWRTVAHRDSCVFRRSPVPASAPPRVVASRGAPKGLAGVGTAAGMKIDGVTDARFDASGLEIEIPLPSPIGTKRLQRPIDEPVSKALARLTATIEKARKKIGSKKKTQKDDGQKPNESPPPNATLVKRSPDDRSVISDETSNTEAWQDGVVLVIDGIGEYRVRVNAPFVETVSVAGYPTVGAPLVAVAGGTKHCDEDRDLRWVWFRVGKEGMAVEVSQGRVYVPTDMDVGYKLKVEAMPKPPAGDDAPCQSDPASFTTPRATVVAKPRPDAHARKAALGPHLNDDTTVRVMTYNALADAYSHTWSELYPYLKPETADPQRRLPLAMEDIRMASPDVVALQEIDRKWYHEFWVPQMDKAGYEPAGGLAEKTGLTREGCATFVRRDRWRVMNAEVISLKQPGPMPDESEIDKFIQQQPHLQEALGKISTVGLVTTLEPVVGEDETNSDANKTDKRCPVVVANAHLFFHPGATHVRVLQTRWLLRHAHKTREAYSAESSDTKKTKVGLVVCGDFNAEPFDAAARFAANGRLSAGDGDWALGSVFRWGGTSSRAAAAELLLIDPEEDAKQQEEQARDGESKSSDPGSVPTSLELEEKNQKLGRMAASWRVVSETERGARPMCGIEVLEESASNIPLLLAQEHARSGCTFKTCACVAAWQFRKDANMRTGVSLRGVSRVWWPGADPLSDEPGGGGGQGTVDEWARGDMSAPLPESKNVRRGGRPDDVSGSGTSPTDSILDSNKDELFAATAAARTALDVHRAGLTAVSLANASLEQNAMDAIESANEKANGWGATQIGQGAMHLRHPLSLSSACGYQEWTNYVSGFTGALDYIWCDTGSDLEGRAGMKSIAFAPMPSLESVTAQTALPNDQFPSDHLPMVADLQFIE